MYFFFFAFCNMTFDFLLVRLIGAGVLITTSLKRSCSEHARLREKILQALWGEDDFFHEPEGLCLACTRRTRITFACGYEDSAAV
jgi:hypothetical protein